MNTTNNFLTISYNGATVEKNNEHHEWRTAYTNQTNPKLYMPSGDAGVIGFYVSDKKYFEDLVGAWVTLELILENRLGERF